MKALYTEAAARELESFKANQQLILEKIVAERKLVFGDEVLEITASDVKKASQRIRPIQPIIRHMRTTDIVTRAYIVIGIGLMVGAFFYPQIQVIFVENRIQAMIFFMGAAMAAIGWLFNYWVRFRRENLDETENYFLLKKMQNEALRDRQRKNIESE